MFDHKSWSWGKNLGTFDQINDIAMTDATSSTDIMEGAHWTPTVAPQHHYLCPQQHIPADRCGACQ